MSVANWMRLVFSLAVGTAVLRLWTGPRMRAGDFMLLPYLAQAPGFLLLAIRDWIDRGRLRARGLCDDPTDRPVRNRMGWAAVMFGVSSGAVAIPVYSGGPNAVLLQALSLNVFLAANGFLASAFVRNRRAGSVGRSWFLGSILLINLPICLLGVAFWIGLLGLILFFR